MARAGLSSFSLHLPDALGDPWFELDEGGKSVAGEFRQEPTLDLLDFPGEVAAHGINCVDLCIQHIPNIEPGYLAELRAAFESANVELYQLLIDIGEVGSSDPEVSAAGVALTKRWMEIAAELGSSGVRYVPGDSKPSPQTISRSGELFRELYDYSVACGVAPATENYKIFNNEADDLLQVLDLSERDYGVVADFGNAKGPGKYDTLSKLMPRATAVHLWVAIDDAGVIDDEDSKRCLNMALENGFDGPVMLLGGHPYQQYRDSRAMWDAVDELCGRSPVGFRRRLPGLIEFGLEQTMVTAAVSTVTLAKSLGSPRYLLDAEAGAQVGSIAEAPTVDLLDLPAAAAARDFHSFDLSVYHLPSIKRGYLAELRSAFEDAKVELFQLLIDTGDVDSEDSDERDAGIAHIKRWMEIAVELGARGVRYVPGDSLATAATIRSSGEAFRELADYAVECGLRPATENFRRFNLNADDLLAVLDYCERDYGLVADFGNARGLRKYETLQKIMPRATSIHAWAEVDDEGDLISEDFRRCLTIARDNGFDGPIMLQSGYPVDVFQRTREVWTRVDEMRDEVRSVFGDN